jgi:excisionase family DNA binding protein
MTGRARSRPVVHSAAGAGSGTEVVAGADPGGSLRDAAGQRGGSTPGVLPLYTPADAAGLLAVRESWLRRRAAERRVPCTFLGKHLRFSRADLEAIAAAAARPTGPPTPLRRRSPRRR